MKKCVNFNGGHQSVDCFYFSQNKIRVRKQSEDGTTPKFPVVNDRSDSCKWILVTQEWLRLPLLRSVLKTPSMSFSLNNLLQNATCPPLSQISNLVKLPITVSLKSTPLAPQCWSITLLPSPVGSLIIAALGCCWFSYWKLVIPALSSCTFSLPSKTFCTSSTLVSLTYSPNSHQMITVSNVANLLTRNPSLLLTLLPWVKNGRVKPWTW
jgi:hypothetical protein